MIKETAIPAVLAAALTLAGPAARAAPWTVDGAKSTIAFRATQFGRPLEGRFRRFAARLSFEPGPRPTGSVRVEIDVLSIATGDSDRDSQARGPAWFSAATAPRAVFAADRFRRVAPDRYVADGTLAIHGVARPASLPFTLSIAGERAVARGSLAIDRLAYRLGAGVSEATVGRTVTVAVTVVATRASGAR